MHTLLLDWDKDGNKLRNHMNATPPTNFTTLGIDPGDVLHIYCRMAAFLGQPQTQNSFVVTVREVTAGHILIADRFKDAPLICSPANRFTVIVNKQKMKMTASTPGLLGFMDDAFSTWRVDNLGDLHIIPSGTDGLGGAPCSQGNVSIWGETEILRGADPTGSRSLGRCQIKNHVL